MSGCGGTIGRSCCDTGLWTTHSASGGKPLFHEPIQHAEIAVVLAVRKDNGSDRPDWELLRAEAHESDIGGRNIPTVAYQWRSTKISGFRAGGWCRGFARLTAGRAVGHAGLVIDLEAERLARSNVDWFRLLDLLRRERHGDE